MLQNNVVNKVQQNMEDDISIDTESKHHQHSEICRELLGIYTEKNKRYGDSFSKTFKELGIISAVTRMTDKMNCIKQLSVGVDASNDESLRDSLCDLANYAIMTVMEMDNKLAEKYNEVQVFQIW